MVRGESGPELGLDQHAVLAILIRSDKIGPGTIHAGVETREVSDGVNVDVDARGKLVGFDIDRAANQFDLSSLETTALPLRSYRIG